MGLNNITFEKFKELLEKNTITTSDRFLIDSYVYTPLVEFCGNIRPNEIEKVHFLEEKNLFRFLNSVGIALGMKGEEALLKALSIEPLSYMIPELKKQYKGKELEKMVIACIVKVLLSLGGNEILTPKFEGEMPQKFMSFRNQTAKEWFGNFVDNHLYSLITIYEKLSIEEAQANLIASLAYHLHQSNPLKYAIDFNLSDDENLKNIIKKFLIEQKCESLISYSNTGEILSKVL